MGSLFCSQLHMTNIIGLNRRRLRLGTASQAVVQTCVPGLLSELLTFLRTQLRAIDPSARELDTGRERLCGKSGSDTMEIVAAPEVAPALVPKARAQPPLRIGGHRVQQTKTGSPCTMRILTTAHAG